MLNLIDVQLQSETYWCMKWDPWREQSTPRFLNTMSLYFLYPPLAGSGIYIFKERGSTMGHGNSRTVPVVQTEPCHPCLWSNPSLGEEAGGVWMTIYENDQPGTTQPPLCDITTFIRIISILLKLQKLRKSAENDNAIIYLCLNILCRNRKHTAR